MPSSLPSTIVLPDSGFHRDEGMRWGLWLERNASLLFWGLFFLHLLCWTLIPTLTQPNAPLDVIEGLAWGHEWPLGTYKHPPLQAWLLEGATYLFGQSGLGFFGLSALAGSISLWAVYRTGRLFTTRAKALIAALLAQSIFYLNILATEFNPNVLQLVLGALGTYAFAHAVLRQKLKYWLLLGFFCALGLYAKYSFAIFGLTFLVTFLAVRPIRSLLFSVPAYMALALVLVLFMPHLQWLIANAFLPFSYAAERAEQAPDLWLRVFFPAKFFSAQILAMVAALGLTVLLCFPFRREEGGAFKKHILFWLAWGPLLLALLLSLASGMKFRDMWGMPLLTFIPLWFACRFTIHFARLKAFATGWGIIFALGLTAFAFNLLFAPSLGFKPLRGHFPGREIAATLHHEWQKRTGLPLSYVVGDAWLAGNVAFYGPDVRERAHVWIDAADRTSPWIRPQNVKGAIVLWRITDSLHDTPPAWVKRFRSFDRQENLVFHWKTDTKAEPVTLGWAFITQGIKIQ